MTVTVVVGLQWGDEGKGKISDYLASENDIVVRFSGGTNARHTIVHEGKEVQLSLLPSGIMHEHTQLVIADGMAVDPYKLYSEIKHLEELVKFDVSRLLISQLASVTFPYHIYFDRVNDAIISNLMPIGTTGSGIGPTYTDYVARQGVRMFEFLDPTFMQGEVFKRVSQLSTHSPFVSRLWGMLILNEDYNKFKKLRKVLKPLVINTSAFLNDAILQDKNVLFEGAQGTMLDVRYGFYPYVTSSHTLAGGVCVGAGISPTKIDQVVGVVKAYSTRVSYGPFITQLSGKLREKIVIKGHEYIHDSQTPLRVGWLDLVALRHAIQLNQPNYIALTKLDVLSDLDKIKVCIAYKRNEKVYKDLPLDFSEPDYKPVLIDLPGWRSFKSKSITTSEDLPVEALNYIQYIEEHLQTPVKLISLGRERFETVVK